MQFLSKHYEKIILSVVLAGLAVAAALLLLNVSSVQADLDNVTQGIITRKIDPLPPLDLSTNQMVLRRVTNRQPIALAQPGHLVFNPIMWIKTPEGRMMPKEDTGLGALSVTNIVPLRTTIEYRSARQVGSSIRYEFLATREAASNSSFHRPFVRIVGVGESAKEAFLLKEVRGPVEDPTELVLVLAEDSKQVVTVAKDRPYSEVAGYAADLYHEVDRRSYPRQRQGQKLTLGGNSYNIVAISEADVTLEDQATKKRTTLRWKPAS
jgi:hypothetical protein